MPRLLIATGNAGKAREFRALLAGGPFEVVEAAVLGWTVPEIPETGETFAANAERKAVETSRLLPPGQRDALLVLGDDSGLCVDALGGAPGIFSARYAADGRHVERLLEEMRGIPEQKRAARFVCCLALARAGALLRAVTGTVEGRIAERPSGTGGFGYDPVFYFPPLGRTFAELAAPEKGAVSHRARAVAALLAAIRAG